MEVDEDEVDIALRQALQEEKCGEVDLGGGEGECVKRKGRIG